MDPFEAVKQTFYQECEELLGDLERGLLAMQDGERDAETVNAVFRAVHSVKGGAGAFGLDDLVGFAHVFETLLDEVRAGRTDPDAAMIGLLLRSADLLADHISAARSGGSVDAERTALATAELQAAIGGDIAAGEEDDFDFGFVPLMAPGATVEADAPAPWRLRFQPKSELYAKGNDAALLLRELDRLGPAAATLDETNLPGLEALEPETAYLAWTVELDGALAESDVREVFDFVEDECELELTRSGEGDAVEPEEKSEPEPEPQDEIGALLASVLGDFDARTSERTAAPPPPADEIVVPLPRAASQELAPQAATSGATATTAASAGATIRVDLERVDRLIDLIGELVITQAMLSQRAAESGLPRTSAVALCLEDLEQLTRGIQDSVMAIRAQPVRSVFQRMPRLVREVADATKKRVRLVTEGEQTEVDKTVIERLSDPITHMLRNAIDHGLETPEDRVAAGKPAEGTVRLSAVHRSGRIVIEVSDDGRGLDRSRVRGKAIEKGLISPDAALTDEEIDNLIFLPGFSTAAAVSDISGRGVGMDVVKRSVQALGGRIGITSRPGQGSTFSMSLPLTLAVLDGMVVTAADQTLVAPLGAIVETLIMQPDDLKRFGPHDALLRFREAYVPVLDLGAALGFRATPQDLTKRVAMVVENELGVRTALVIDAVQGQRQVVIKSLDSNFRPVDGVAAATILGNGRVALIVDVERLVAVAERAVTPPRALAS